MKHASLFSGIGGPEIAAEMMGWENAFHCEIDPFCREILQYWFPKSVSYGDITKKKFDEWRGRIDVLTGGFPCQPFSYSGKRGGANDERYLWPEMCRVVDEIRPTWVVCENVGGIATMVETGVCIDLGCETALFEEDNNIHRFEFVETFTIERIRNDFEQIGYGIQPFVIPAAGVGAPQRRDRIFIVAHNDRDPDRLGAFVSTKQKVCGENAKSGRICETGCGNDAWKYDERGGWIPTFSPVCRGNDGLPFDVDRLAIPFVRWQNESLKAFGNAIVPQVMYEIFLAIEAVYLK